MYFENLVNLRHSVRKYLDKAVEKEKLYKCIEAARLAPSACNSQPWRYIIIENPEIRKKVAEATYTSLVGFNKFTETAPVLVALVNTKGTMPAKIAEKIKGRQYDVFDCGISAGFFTLQAAELGLGTCMIGWFDEKSVKDVLAVPEKYSVELIITVGYPDESEKSEKKRKEINFISTLNSFKEN